MSDSPTSPQLPGASPLSRLLQIVRPNELALILSILVVLGGTAALDKSHAYVRFPGRVLKDNCRRLAPLGMLALGATVVIIAGGIDLSVGPMAAFTGTFKGTDSEELPFSDPFMDLLKDEVWISMVLMLVLAAFTWVVLNKTILG